MDQSSIKLDVSDWFHNVQATITAEERPCQASYYCSSQDSEIFIINDCFGEQSA